MKLPIIREKANETSLVLFNSAPVSQKMSSLEGKWKSEMSKLNLNILEDKQERIRLAERKTKSPAFE